MSHNNGFADLVVGEALIPDLQVASRDAALRALCMVAADITDLPAALVLERVRTREALGPTGFGGGAAIPHARIDGLAAVTVLVARLARPVDWQALDGTPVDVVVLLLSPEDAGADHLKALARISRALRDPACLAALRAAEGVEAMRAAIGAPVTTRSAVSA